MYFKLLDSNLKDSDGNSYKIGLNNVKGIDIYTKEVVLDMLKYYNFNRLALVEVPDSHLLELKTTVNGEGYFVTDSIKIVKVVDIWNNPNFLAYIRNCWWLKRKDLFYSLVYNQYTDLVLNSCIDALYVDSWYTDDEFAELMYLMGVAMNTEGAKHLESLRKC